MFFFILITHAASEMMSICSVVVDIDFIYFIIRGSTREHIHIIGKHDIIEVDILRKVPSNSR